MTLAFPISREHAHAAACAYGSLAGDYIIGCAGGVDHLSANSSVRK